MAVINRSEVIQKAVNDLGLSTSHDKIPTDTLDKVQLTYNLNKQYSHFSLASNSTGTGTITITPGINGDVYISGVTCSYIKDATCDQATGSMSVVVTPETMGQAASIFRFAVLTTTAQSDTVTISFPYPLKIKQGSTITWSATYSAGTMSRAITVIGFNNTSF